MFAVRHVVLCAVLAVSLASVNGLTDEEISQIKALILPFVKECGTEYGVTEEDIKAAKDDGTLKDLDPCLIACVFKKIGLITDKGTFDDKKAAELTEKYLSVDEDQKKTLEVIETCTSVNDQAVGDGDKGCERAKLLVECYMPLKGRIPGAP